MELAQIYTEFQLFLTGFISARVNNPDDVSDILQDVFYKLATKAQSLRDERKIKGWVLSVTRNTIIDYYRKRSKEPETLEVENTAARPATDEPAENDSGLDVCLKRFIGELPAEYRNIVIDSEIEGLKQKDLAEKYGMKYSSVRSRIQRGRARLKTMLTDCCKIDLDNHGNILAVSQNRSGSESCFGCK